MIDNIKNTAMKPSETKRKETFAFAPQDGFEAFTCEAESLAEATELYEKHLTNIKE